MSVIVDASAFLAWADSADAFHAAATEALSNLEDQPIAPALPVAEASYLIGRRVGAHAEIRFVQALTAFQLVAPTTADLYRMAELMEQYADWPLGAADASIVALAERLYIDTIITFDRRHFAAVKPRHVDAFRVLPE